jgi:hypothetical protein
MALRLCTLRLATACRSLPAVHRNAGHFMASGRSMAFYCWPVKLNFGTLAFWPGGKPRILWVCRTRTGIVVLKLTWCPGRVVSRQFDRAVILCLEFLAGRSRGPPTTPPAEPGIKDGGDNCRP